MSESLAVESRSNVPYGEQPLIGIPFDDGDETIRQALAEVSVPALLMSMVHMTGDLGILARLPQPYLLIANDLQGGMSEPDKASVRECAFEVVRDYRDRGCPPPFVPDERELGEMLDVLTAGEVTDEFIEYIAADVRITDADQIGPPLRSTPQQRNDFPVVVIGCGESGLLAGIKLKEAGIPFTIIEKQPSVGGTWRLNRYPGCRVDISNQYYAYSFEPTDHWTHFFSEQPEIMRYLTDVMDRHAIAPFVRFDTAVKSAVWEEDSDSWTVLTRAQDGTEETLRARALICAVGQFSNPVIPDVRGKDDFAGPVFHTAAWDDDVDLSGKRVAVIGAGASGFQLVPAIAAHTQQVDVYQRTAQWMAPNVNYHEPIGDGARWAVRHLPYYSRWLRFVLWWPITDAVHDIAAVDPQWDGGGKSVNERSQAIREMFIAWMRVFCDDEELLAKVTPDYPPLGKRTLQDNGTWLKTLQRDDVELIRDGIERITADGVLTDDGVHRPADVLIWATGFDVNHQLGPVDIRGRDGRALNAVWGDAAYAYLGITVPEFPNFFCLFGPGTNAVNGSSVMYTSECQMRYTMGCIDALIADGLRSLSPRPEVCADYTRRSNAVLSRMVYTHPSVSSYYKNSAGEVPTIFAWRIVDYWKWTRRPDLTEYELRAD